MKALYSFIILLCIFLLAAETTAYSEGNLNEYTSAYSHEDSEPAAAFISKNKRVHRSYTIQVAHITDLEEAKRRAEQISQRVNLPIWIKKNTQNYYVILAGKTEKDTDLSDFENILKEKGYPQASIVNDSYSAIPAIMEILPAQSGAILPTVKNKPAKAGAFSSFYTIQVAHITTSDEAKKRAKHLSHITDLRTRIKEKGPYYILLAGGAERRSDLLDDMRIIRENGYPQATIINNHRIEPPEALVNVSTIAVTKERQSNLLSLVQKTHYGADDYGVFETEEMHHSTEGMENSGEAGNNKKNNDIVQAWDSYRSGNYTQALNLFNEILSFSETVLEAKLGKACCFAMQNDFTEVVPLLKELKEKNYKLEKLANIFFEKKQFDEAIELCDRILYFNPFNTDVLYLKLNILVQTRQFMEARMILANVSGEKNSLKLLQLRADLECWLENYDGAIVLYKELIRKWPENGDIWFGYLKALSSAQEWSLLSKAIKEGIDKIEMSDERSDFLVEMYLSLEETEKAIRIWRGMDTASDHWRKTLFAIVNRLTVDKKREMVVQVLEQALAMDGANAQVAGELALNYASLDMPEKGMEVLRQFKKTPETETTMNIAKAQLLSLIENYETALSLLQTVEQGNDNNYKSQLIELECYYGLEDYEALIARSSSLLQKYGEDEFFPKSRVLALRILTHIKTGLQAEAENEIGVLFETQENKYTAAMLSVLLYAYEGMELLSAMENADYGSAVFSLSLFASSGQLEEHYESIQVLGEVLKEPSLWSDAIQQQLIEDELSFVDKSKVIALRMLHAWKIADELSGHNNASVKTQLAMAEYRAGNFQGALELYDQLYSMHKDASYKLGMMESFLAMNNRERAVEVCNEIHISNLPRQEIPRYLENLVKLEIESEVFYKIISELPDDLTKNTRIMAAVVTANIQYGDYFLANKILTEYLLNNQSYISLSQLIMNKVGAFDKGKGGKYYQFVKYWLNYAVDLYPENASLQYQYARSLAMHGEYELAQKQFLTMWESNPSDIRVMRWMGRLNSRTQQFETSLKWYDLYVKTRPSDIIVRREREHVHHWVLCKKQSDMASAIVCQLMPGNYNRCWEWQAKRSDLNAKQQSMFLQDTFTENYQKSRYSFPRLKQVAFYDESGSERRTISRGILDNNYGDNGYSFDQNAGKWKRNQAFVFPVYSGVGDVRERRDSPYPLSVRINKYFAIDLPTSMDPALSFEEKLMDFKKFNNSIADHCIVTLNEGFEERLKNYIEERILQYSGESGNGERFDIIGNNRMGDTLDLSLQCYKEEIKKGFYVAPSYEVKNISTKLGRIFLGSMLGEG